MQKYKCRLCSEISVVSNAVLMIVVAPFLLQASSTNNRRRYHPFLRGEYTQSFRGKYDFEIGNYERPLHGKRFAPDKYLRLPRGT